MTKKKIDYNLTCCIIGHEANKLPWGLYDYDVRCIKLKERLTDEIVNSYLYCYDNYMFDPIPGVGLIVGDILLDLKKRATLNMFVHVIIKPSQS